MSVFVGIILSMNGRKAKLLRKLCKDLACGVRPHVPNKTVINMNKIGYQKTKLAYSRVPQPDRPAFLEAVPSLF